MFTTRSAALAVSVASILIANCPSALAADQEAADTVLRNGFVWTVDKQDSQQQALAVRDGEVVYVGDNAGVERWIGPDTKVVDLGGKMVMPGLQDAHVHSLIGGAALVGCTLNYEPLTTEQFQSRIQACLDKTPDAAADTTLVVQSWYRQAMRPSGTDASAETLDALKTKRPILVVSTDHHSMLANNAALAKAGITAETAQPDGGKIAHLETGKPSGILEDSAVKLVGQLTPAPDPGADNTAGAVALKEFAAQGVTAFMDQMSTPVEGKVYNALRNEGALTARVSLAPDVDMKLAATDPQKAAQAIFDFRKNYELGEEGPEPTVRVRNVAELFTDGVTQAPAQTASMLAPYFVNKGTADAPNWVPGDWSGPEPYYSAPTLIAVTTLLIKNGIVPEVHAIGDRSVRMVLDAYEAVRQSTNSPLPLLIGHAENVDPADFPRFAKLNVQPAMGLQWAKPSFDSIDGTEKQLGPERFARSEPIGSLYDAGVLVSQGSDWPVDKLDEWASMEVAVTRTNPDPDSGFKGALGAERGLTVPEAIRVLTINGARAMLHDDKTGSLETGKYADFIVIDQNIVEAPKNTIHKTKVLATVVGGKTVYGQLD